jgi:hypothetical protein
MTTPKDKVTVYVDVDDEITTVIDKMRSADGRIVALVLPKRAALMQSIVNMKLLKRSADDSKKRLVLITTEAGLLPLAGAAGIHVASTLQSAPAIPAVAGLDNADDIDSVSADADDPADALNLDEVAETPIGELAGVPAAVSNEPETIELDNDDAPAAVAATKGAKKPKGKKNSKLKVPNFSRFRVLITLGIVALVVLGFFLYLALAVLPKATITISTDSSDVKTNATVTLDPNAATVSADASTIPASTQQKQASSAQQVAASGSQNNGNQAHGSVIITNCSNSDVTIPAGTGLSANGQTYLTATDLSLNSGNFDSSQHCKASGNHVGSVGVTAQKGGAGYNVDNNTTFTVASSSSYDASSLKARANGPVNGGTDNIVKVVAQADIDSAKQKLGAVDTNPFRLALQQALQQNGFTPIPITFNGGTPTITQSANVGDKVDTVTVTQVTTYVMYGAKESDLKKVVVANVNKQIDESKQAILDDGTSKATYKVTNTAPEQVVLSATSTTGPHIVVDQLKAKVAGMKAGAIRDLIKQTPGVTDVKVKYSPFWVDSTPKKASKITVIFQKQQ